VQCDDQPSEGECVLSLTECTKDAQCDAPEVCTALGVTSECSGSGSASPSCAPGSDCPAPPPPPEEQCTETTHSFCFPQRHDCSGGEKCPADTRCVKLPEDSLDHPPPGWEGVSALCLPEGWALVIEGRAETDGGGTDSSAEASSSGRDTAKGGQANDVEHNVPEDDGCAVHTPGSGSGGMWPPVFGLALGLLGLVRRRRTPR
jgi:MYXO-CTERM domain-containing protein